jgi:hypothetical protein
MAIPFPDDSFMMVWKAAACPSYGIAALGGSAAR